MTEIVLWKYSENYDFQCEFIIQNIHMNEIAISKFTWQAYNKISS